RIYIDFDPVRGVAYCRECCTAVHGDASAVGILVGEIARITGRANLRGVRIVAALVQVLLLDIRQQMEEEGAACSPGPIAREKTTGRRELIVRVMTGVGRYHHLMEVVAALDPGGRLADFLHRRQQQADEDGDDGYHHQQLNERERTSTLRPSK